MSLKENRILLWRAVRATSKRDKDATVTDLAGRLHTSFEATEASVDQFIEIRKQVIEEDDC